MAKSVTDEDKKKAKKTTPKKKTYAKKPKLDEDGNVLEKRTVQDIVVERLLAKIESEKRLPWQRPFQSACMNWFSKREYKGINKILLDGGEYITPNQIKAYNEKHKTDFWFESGTPWEIVVFYSRQDKIINDGLAKKIISEGKNTSRIFPTDKGWVMRTWFLRYYRVYNIVFVKDKEGNTLPPHIGTNIIETHTPAEAIIERYLNVTGVGLKLSGDGAYYREAVDSVFHPERNKFASTEALYRVIFHELIHSTGIEKRLKRQCFKDYHEGSRERSREELIAEVGGLLLASEAGFRDDTQWADNSMEYIAGWCSWMKDNKNEVLNGMLAAEKAKTYILEFGAPVNTDNLAAEEEEDDGELADASAESDTPKEAPEADGEDSETEE
jgi:antirestriction protein ArdC